MKVCFNVPLIKMKNCKFLFVLFFLSTFSWSAIRAQNGLEQPFDVQIPGDLSDEIRNFAKMVTEAVDSPNADHSLRIPEQLISAVIDKIRGQESSISFDVILENLTIFQAAELKSWLDYSNFAADVIEDEWIQLSKPAKNFLRRSLEINPALWKDRQALAQVIRSEMQLDTREGIQLFLKQSQDITSSIGWGNISSLLSEFSAAAYSFTLKITHKPSDFLVTLLGTLKSCAPYFDFLSDPTDQQTKALRLLEKNVFRPFITARLAKAIKVNRKALLGDHGYQQLKHIAAKAGQHAVH